jgi:opacity protein-like surface antigen
MHRTIALVSAFAVACAVQAAAAAPSTQADFSGLSIGLQTSYGFGASDWCFCNFVGPAVDATGGRGGIVVGGHAAYGARLGPIVLEGEGRLSYANVAFAETCGPALACAGALQWLGEADATAGYAFGDTMFAATLGYAEGDVRATTSVTAGPARGTAREETTTHEGRVYGARLEQAMSGGWRFGLEYRYYDMQGTNLAADPAGAPTQVAIDWHAHVAGLTISYELNK